MSVRKAEAETARTSLCHRWAAECDMRPDYLRFRPSLFAEYDTETWFDPEYKQAGDDRPVSRAK